MLGALSILFELAKARVTAAIAFSTAAGSILAAETTSFAIGLPVLGVVLLSAGSGALNQVQEARLDRLMERTRGRPIPSGRIAASQALLVALALILAGLAVLARAGPPVLPALGLLGVFWYNGLYTHLKRLTAFAVVPGALVGTLPPAIGWVSAGGALDAAPLAHLALFLGLWQIPHFWLLQLLFAADYERAGLPTLSRHFTPRQLGRLTCAWIAAVVSAGLLVGLQARLALPWIVPLLLASLLLLWSAAAGLTLHTPQWPRRIFLALNLYGLAFLLALIGAKLTKDVPALNALKAPGTPPAPTKRAHLRGGSAASALPIQADRRGEKGQDQ